MKVEKVIRSTDQQEICEIVGRELEASELATYEALEVISKPVVAITAKTASQYRLLACKYLHERVPSADLDAVMLKVEAIMNEAKRAAR